MYSCLTLLVCVFVCVCTSICMCRFPRAGSLHGQQQHGFNCLAYMHVCLHACIYEHVPHTLTYLQKHTLAHTHTHTPYKHTHRTNTHTVLSHTCTHANRLRTHTHMPLYTHVQFYPIPKISLM